MTGDLAAYALAFGVTQAGFLALWGLSLAWRDASVVDFWWGPGFLAQMAAVAAAGHAPMDARGWLLVGLVALWSLRLGVVLGRRRLREGHEDPRYTELRRAWDPGFWWKSLFLVFVLQAVVQWVVAIGPLAGLMAAPVPLGWLAAAGAAVALAGFALEAAADAQLDAFKRRAGPGALCETGLRAHLRHPNYLGEILFWVGIALVVVEAGAWAGLVAPVVMTLLLTRVSGAPMLDEHLSRTRPGYAGYRARVPGFLPGLRPQVRGRSSGTAPEPAPRTHGGRRAEP